MARFPNKCTCTYKFLKLINGVKTSLEIVVKRLLSRSRSVKDT